MMGQLKWVDKWVNKGRSLFISCEFIIPSKCVLKDPHFDLHSICLSIFLLLLLLLPLLCSLFGI